MGALFFSPIRKRVTVSWAFVGTPRKRVFRSSMNFCQRGYVLLINCIIGVMMGSPKKPKPAPNPAPFIAMYGVVKYDARSAGTRHDARIRRGLRRGKGDVGLRALPNLSHVSTKSDSM